MKEYILKWDSPSKKVLEELYIDRHLSANKIGDMYGVTPATVIKRLRYHEIEVRKRGIEGKSIVCDILKKHAKDLKDDPERLSTGFMQNLIGVQCNGQVATSHPRIE